jgi:hypothetical protein
MLTALMMAQWTCTITRLLAMNSYGVGGVLNKLIQADEQGYDAICHWMLFRSCNARGA